MKRWMLVIPVLTLLLAYSAGAQAAAPAKTPAASRPPAAFTVQGKILKMAKGRFQLQLTRVEQAAGLKAGQAIWIQETAKTKIMQAGKTVKPSALKVGEQVEVHGNIVKTKTVSTYSAATVQIVSPR